MLRDAVASTAADGTAAVGVVVGAVAAGDMAAVGDMVVAGAIRAIHMAADTVIAIPTITPIEYLVSRKRDKKPLSSVLERDPSPTEMSCVNR
jgi:hypothetical protein